MKKIIVFIPCLNEEEGIARVIKGIPHKKLLKHGYKIDVVVIDNGSDDRTAKIAKKLGATVLNENKKGKGNALKKGFGLIDRRTEFVVMVDGDDTYKTSEIIRLIEPIESGFSDVIVGSRLSGNLLDESFKLSNKLGDHAITFLTSRIYKRAKLTDALSGFVAWRASALKKVLPHIASGGFGIEMEMIAKLHKLGFRIHSVPITYDKRAGRAKLKFWDSLKILYSFGVYSKWKPKN